MELTFSVPVRGHRFAIRCIPQDSGRQKIRVEQCLIAPADSITKMTDGFGNLKLTGNSMQPHDSFTVCVTGTAMTDGMKAVGEPLHPMYRYPSAFTQPDETIRAFAEEMRRLWEDEAAGQEQAGREPVPAEDADVRICVEGEHGSDTSAGDCAGRELRSCVEEQEDKEEQIDAAQNSQNGEELQECGTAGQEERRAAARGILALGVQVMGALYERMEYVPGTTDIHTTAGEALAQRRGVCQDYAHIMIAVMRCLGVPARYVNGIMIGEGATHAWVEIYTGEGWYGLDPTNNLHIDGYYIKFSHGRDYGDCVVDKGRFLGFAAQEQKIYVNVEEIEK